MTQNANRILADTNMFNDSESYKRNKVASINLKRHLDFNRKYTIPHDATQEDQSLHMPIRVKQRFHTNLICSNPWGVDYVSPVEYKLNRFTTDLRRARHQATTNLPVLNDRTQHKRRWEKMQYNELSKMVTRRARKL